VSCDSFPPGRAGPPPEGSELTPTRAFPRALSGVAVLALSLGGAVGAFVVSAGPAAADTVNVTNTADDGTSTSLRGVLESANDGDVIVLTAGATYQLTICNPPVVKALEGSSGWGDVEISGAVTIQGNGATIEQTCEDRVLYTQDEITIENTTITGGNVEGPGGGLFQDSDNPTTLTGVTFTGNDSLDGGGVATSGNVFITDSTFSGNEAFGSGDGGGLKVYSDVATVEIGGSTFSGNTAGGWGGAFEQEGQSGGEATGVFQLTVTTSSIVGNTAEGDGAGGLDTEDPSTTVIDHSTLSGNTGGLAGAVGNFTDNTDFSANASTFSGNTSHGAGSAVLGGGTYSFVNSTITGNTVAGFGAVNVEDLTLLHVTMTNNTSLGQDESGPLSTRGLGSLALEDDAANIVTPTLTSTDSVVAQPHGAVNCSGGRAQEMSAAAAIPSSTDGGYNFSDDTSCGFTAVTSSQKTPNDPMLGALTNNGGATETLLPLAGSPLLDAIPPAVCGSNVDQRDITRPQGAGCDIGAVEVVVVAPAPAPAAVVTPKFTG
jgi:hypothetical protein